MFIHITGGYEQTKHVASNRGLFRLSTITGWRQPRFALSGVLSGDLRRGEGVGVTADVA